MSNEEKNQEFYGGMLDETTTMLTARAFAGVYTGTCDFTRVPYAEDPKIDYPKVESVFHWKITASTHGFDARIKITRGFARFTLHRCDGGWPLIEFEVSAHDTTEKRKEFISKCNIWLNALEVVHIEG